MHKFTQDKLLSFENKCASLVQVSQKQDRLIFQDQCIVALPTCGQVFIQLVTLSRGRTAFAVSGDSRD
jgi:hypothetical protein